jgi:hypothetical protein
MKTNTLKDLLFSNVRLKEDFLKPEPIQPIRYDLPKKALPDPVPVKRFELPQELIQALTPSKTYESPKKVLPEPIKPKLEIEPRPYVGRDPGRMDMGNTLLDRKPELLERVDSMRPENRRYPFEDFVNVTKNYKTGGVAPLEPINPNPRFEPIQISQPRNPNVDYRQFEEMDKMKYKF